MLLKESSSPSAGLESFGQYNYRDPQFDGEAGRVSNLGG